MVGEAIWIRHWQGCRSGVVEACRPLVAPALRGVLVGGGPSLSTADGVSGCMVAALWWKLQCSWAVLTARVQSGSLGHVGDGVAGVGGT